MTLIITLYNKFGFVQISDRKLTYPDGTLYDDKANKAICLNNKDSFLALAYTGLAILPQYNKQKRTDLYIIDYLAKMNAGNKTLLETVETLSEHLTKLFTYINKIKKQSLTLVFAGYTNDIPIICTITNREDENKNDTEVQEKFIYRIEKIITTTAYIQINGMTKALDETFWPHVDNYKHKLQQPLDKVIPTLIQLIRWASSDKKYGIYIGKNLMSITLPINGNYIATYHPWKSSTITYGPHVILKNLAVMEIESTNPNFTLEISPYEESISQM